MTTECATPLVSVIIPTYNCAAYIRDAIRSVLAQTYPHYEIIVIDDGSTDDTQDVLAEHKGQITYLYQKNAGVVAARNAGIDRARGELVAFLDADDTWYPEKLRLQTEAFCHHPQAGLAFTDFEEFADSGILRATYFGDVERARRWFQNHATESREIAYGRVYPELLRVNWIHTSTVMVTRNALRRVGSFDADFPVTQDYDLWLRIAREYPALCTNRVLCGFRCRAEGLSGSQIVRTMRWNSEIIKVIEKHLQNGLVPREFLPLARNEVSRVAWTLGWQYYDLAQYRQGRAYFAKSLKHCPFHAQSWLYLAATLLPPPLVRVARSLKHRLRSPASQPNGAPTPV